MRAAVAVALHQLPADVDGVAWADVFWVGVCAGWWRAPADPMGDYHRLMEQVSELEAGKRSEVRW